MRNVESKLELLGHSMKQLDLDIQLSVNKQDKHQQSLNNTLQTLQSQINSLASEQQRSNVSKPVAPQQPPANSIPLNYNQSYNSPTQSSMNQPSNSSQTTSSSGNTNENATCPVCSQLFSMKEIHAHIESHFNEGSSVAQVSAKEESSEPGFWGKLFTKKKDSPETLSTQPQNNSGIQPPTYNYSPPPPTAVVPAFYSPTGTVQYISQPR